MSETKDALSPEVKALVKATALSIDALVVDDDILRLIQSPLRALVERVAEITREEAARTVEQWAHPGESRSLAAAIRRGRGSER